MQISTLFGERKSSSLVNLIVESFRAFDRRSQRRIIGILLLTAMGAFLEAAGAALIVPFVAMINDPSYLSTQGQLRTLFEMSPFLTTEGFLIATALTLFLFFVIKNAFALLILNMQFSFVYGEMPRFSCNLYRGYLTRPLAQHARVNSAELIRNVNNEVQLYFTSFLIPTLTLITEVLVLIAIIAVLLLIAPMPAFAAIVLLGGMTKAFYAAVRARVNKYGQDAQHHNAERIKWVNQGLNSIKETRILGSEDFFVQSFNFHENRFAKSSRYAMLLNQTPRLFIETLAFTALFLGVALALTVGQNRSEVLPVLALFAVAAIRLLPSLNRVLLSLTRMAYYRPAARVVLDSHQFTAKPDTNSPFRSRQHKLKDWKELCLQDVSFHYPGSADSIFSNLNLTIKRGTSVALVGPSGSGKTTLADLILGLLTPISGKIEVDGQNIHTMLGDWQDQLGYIPQSIYLLDDTIRRNIAFGVPDDLIDDQQVWKALQYASISDVVRALPGQLDCSVGENGSTLSGGQRQRLGIARALYQEPQFLVLDEATSALDEATESEIAGTLDQLVGARTLLVIAHRPETIRRCQVKYDVSRGGFVE
jgi:ABC-type multidrug transport system fused ATPase/permease subunit